MLEVLICSKIIPELLLVVHTTPATAIHFSSMSGALNHSTLKHYKAKLNPEFLFELSITLVGKEASQTSVVEPTMVNVACIASAKCECGADAH